ncbi:hypothetical protein RI367_002999 [Sorochytrium milnesiophthora]
MKSQTALALVAALLVQLVAAVPTKNTITYTRDAQPMSDDDIVDMITAHAPLVYLHPQEQNMPCSIDWFFPYVKLAEDGANPQPQFPDPVTRDNIGTLPYSVTSNSRLTTKQPLDCGPCHEDFFAGVSPASQPVPAYALYKKKPEVGANVIDVSYWTFYSFNLGKDVCIGVEVDNNCIGGRTWMGDHVGDLEHISIRFDSGQPVQLFNSEHSGGHAFNWNDTAITFVDGTQRPIVYSALGSHGLSLVPHDVVFNKFPKLVDQFSAGGVAWDTALALEVAEWQDPSQAGYSGDHAWLNYAGRWGNDYGCEVHSVCKLVSGPDSISTRSYLTDPTLQRK